MSHLRFDDQKRNTATGVSSFFAGDRTIYHRKNVLRCQMQGVCLPLAHAHVALDKGSSLMNSGGLVNEQEGRNHSLFAA